MLSLGWQVRRHPPGTLLDAPPPFHPPSRPFSLPQRAPEEQGNVTYTLRAFMPACRCAEPAKNDTVVLGTEVTAHNFTLSGAEYEILLTAANAAGPGPAQQLRVPAEQRAGICPAEGPNSPAASRVLFSQPSLTRPCFIPDLGFKDVSVAGSTVSMRWEVQSADFVYCFEQQPLPGTPKQGVCIQRDFPAKSIHTERGKGAP